MKHYLAEHIWPTQTDYRFKLLLYFCFKLKLFECDYTFCLFMNWFSYFIFYLSYWFLFYFKWTVFLHAVLSYYRCILIFQPTIISIWTSARWWKTYFVEGLNWFLLGAFTLILTISLTTTTSLSLCLSLCLSVSLSLSFLLWLKMWRLLIRISLL